jgi:glycine cleavage system H lipoate-binding protein
MVILILIAFVLACILIDFLMNYLAHRKIEVKENVSNDAKPFIESSITAPAGLFYDKSHTWVFMEKNGTVKIGLDDFLIKVTGPLTKIDMKKPGEIVQKGAPALSIIQDGKKLVINAPVTGKIVSNNEEIADNTFSLNSSPYYNGWIYTIEPTNWLKDNRFLLMSEKYKEWLHNEFIRLKDFFSVKRLQTNFEYVPIVLQDGGELQENVLAELGPDVWEDFQTNFINNMK